VIRHMSLENDCEYLQFASGVVWVEAEAPTPSKTVAIGASTWRPNNCNPNQVNMTFLDVKQHHCYWCTWSNTCKIFSNGDCFLSNWKCFIIELFSYSSQAVHVNSRTYLVNSLAMSCKMVAVKSHLQYLIVLCKQVWAKFENCSFLVCRYHF